MEGRKALKDLRKLFSVFLVPSTIVLLDSNVHLASPYKIIEINSVLDIFDRPYEANLLVQDTQTPFVLVSLSVLSYL